MSKKKLFFDFEFTGLHKLTTAISLGIVSEDGRKYYAEYTDFDPYQIDDFLRSEVLSKRILEDYNFETDYKPDAKEVYVKGDVELVHKTLMAWLKPYEKDGVEMWGDLMTWDWILFIDIFGNGLALPEFIDYMPMDLCTSLKLCGIDKDIDREEFAYGEEVAKSRKEKKHNSLHDAETQLAVYDKILEMIQEAADEKKVKSEEGSEEVEEVIEENDVSEESNTPEADKVEVVEAEDVSNEEDENFVPPTQEEIDGANKKANKKTKRKVKPQPKKDDDGFVEPTQADIEASQEFNSPL